MKVFKMLSFGAVAAGIAWGVWYGFFRDGGTEYVYRTQSVTRGSISATVSATGSVNPVEMVDVGTQVSGTIKEIYVDYNSRSPRASWSPCWTPTCCSRGSTR